MNLSKSAILALLVVAGLAAGTVLVAGYADKPGQPAQVTEKSKCNGCPLKGTDACCQTKPAGCCGQAQTCPRQAAPASSEGQPAGCCPRQAPMPCCPASDGEQKTVSPCCAGGGSTGDPHGSPTVAGSIAE